MVLKGKFKTISRINVGSPTTIRRVCNVHPSQGDIRFRLTLRVILQLIWAYFTNNITIDSSAERQRSDSGATAERQRSDSGETATVLVIVICSMMHHCKYFGY